MSIKLNEYLPGLATALLIILLPAAALGGGKLEQSLDADVERNRAAAKSQQRIDQLDDATRSMLQEFRDNTRDAEVLEKYNDHLEKLLDSQEKERESLETQLQEIEVTQREIVPLMLRMLENLEAFVRYDLPFLPEERNQRIAQLKDMMVRADVTNAEKFRRVLEAYQIESDYGRTIEAYRAKLDGRPVDFLRLGRVALFYQTPDGSGTGTWNQESKQWTPLSGEYTRSVRDGLRVARKEAAPDLLVLPIPAAEAAQ